MLDSIRKLKEQLLKLRVFIYGWSFLKPICSMLVDMDFVL